MSLILWDTGLLSKKLSSGTLTDGEKIKYVILNSILLSAVITGSPYLGVDGHQHQQTYDWIGFVIQAGFAIYFYRKIVEMNQLGDGKSLIDRIVCLSWPVSLKVIVFGMIPYIVLSMTLPGKILDHPSTNTIFDIVSELVFFILLTDWIKKTALRSVENT